MKRFTLRVSREASVDTEDCFARIGQDNPKAAERFLQALMNAYERLTEQPGMGSECTAVAEVLPGTRRWVVQGFSNYLIFYRMEADWVEVIRILHGARDYEKALISEPISFDENA